MLARAFAVQGSISFHTVGSRISFPVSLTFWSFGFGLSFLRFDSGVGGHRVLVWTSFVQFYGTFLWC